MFKLPLAAHDSDGRLSPRSQFKFPTWTSRVGPANRSAPGWWLGRPAGRPRAFKARRATVGSARLNGPAPLPGACMECCLQDCESGVTLGCAASGEDRSLRFVRTELVLNGRGGERANGE